MALGELRHGASARRVTLNSRVDPGQIRAGARGEPHAGPTGRNPAAGIALTVNPAFTGELVMSDLRKSV